MRRLSVMGHSWYMESSRNTELARPCARWWWRHRKILLNRWWSTSVASKMETVAVRCRNECRRCRRCHTVFGRRKETDYGGIQCWQRRPWSEPTTGCWELKTICFDSRHLSSGQMHRITPWFKYPQYFLTNDLKAHISPYQPLYPSFFLWLHRKVEVLGENLIWPALHNVITQFPKCTRACRTVHIVVLVEPRPKNASRRSFAPNLDTFASPPLFAVVDGKGCPANGARWCGSHGA